MKAFYLLLATTKACSLCFLAWAMIAGHGILVILTTVAIAFAVAAS
jgi:hypothetical protein